jgi:hypothetical protein
MIILLEQIAYVESHCHGSYDVKPGAWFFIQGSFIYACIFVGCYVFPCDGLFSIEAVRLHIWKIHCLY